MSKNHEEEIMQKTLSSQAVKDLLAVIKEDDRKIILEALKEYSKILSSEVIPNLGNTFNAIQKNPEILNSVASIDEKKVIKDV